MKPTGIYATRPTPQSIVRFFRKSRKRHLFLTGSRGSGKSTLQRQLIPLLAGQEAIPGITSRAVPGQYVLMEENGTGMSAVIGRYRRDAEPSGAPGRVITGFSGAPGRVITDFFGAPGRVITDFSGAPGRVTAGFSGAPAISSSPAEATRRATAPTGLQMSPVAEGFLEIGLPAIRRMIASDHKWVSIDEIGYLETGCPAYCTALEELLDRKSVLAVLRRQDTPLLEKLRTREDVFLYDLDHPLPRPGCVLMASGVSRRFGGNKLLAPFDGKPLITQILAATDTDLFAERVVVTRHREIAELCQASGIRTVLHDLPFRSDTIRLGLEALEDSQPDGCMFCPCDQPLLAKSTVETMAASFIGQPDYIYQLAFGDAVGSPVLFPARCFPALKNLPQGKGGSWLIKNLRQNHDSPIPVNHLPQKYDGSRPEKNLRQNYDSPMPVSHLPQNHDGGLPSGSQPEQVRHINATSLWELKDVDTREDLKHLEGR